MKQRLVDCLRSDAPIADADVEDGKALGRCVAEDFFQEWEVTGSLDRSFRVVRGKLGSDERGELRQQVGSGDGSVKALPGCRCQFDLVRVTKNL